MSDAATGQAQGTEFSACAADLELLARLHDRELEKRDLDALAAAPVGDWFWLRPHDEAAVKARTLIDEYLADMVDTAADELAVDYAQLYLTFGKRIAPNESYWLTEDHIERQGPMFDVRLWLEHYGLGAADWRKRADDHVVSELQFIAHLLREGSTSALGDAAHFLDRHLLLWSKEFFGGMALRADTPFYAGLGLLSQSYIEALRDILAQATGVPRPLPGEVKPEVTVAEPPPAPFVPGMAPSW